MYWNGWRINITILIKLRLMMVVLGWIWMRGLIASYEVVVGLILPVTAVSLIAVVSGQTIAVAVSVFACLCLLINPLAVRLDMNPKL